MNLYLLIQFIDGKEQLYQLPSSVKVSEDLELTLSSLHDYLFNCLDKDILRLTTAYGNQFVLVFRAAIKTITIRKQPLSPQDDFICNPLS